MRDLEQAIATLLARNPNHDGHGQCNNKNTHEPPLHGYNNQNRPSTYDKDDGYEEDVHGGYYGPVRELLVIIRSTI